MPNHDTLIAASESVSGPVYAPYFQSAGYLWRVQGVLLAAAIPATTLPLWWGALQRQRGWTLVDFGIANMAGAIGAMLIGFVLVFAIARVDRRLAIAGLLVSYGLALAGIVFTTSAFWAAIFWGVCFLALAGAETIGLAYLGYSASAERNNSMFVAVQSTMFAVAPPVIGAILPLVGAEVILLAMGLGLLLAVLLVLPLPARLDMTEHRGSSTPADLAGRRRWAAAAVVIGYGLFTWFTVTLYNFSEQFGSAQGMSIEHVAMWMGVAGVFGIAGALAAGWGTRLIGSLAMLFAGTVIYAAACAFMFAGSVGVAAGLVLSSFSWSLLLALILSQMARIDPQGRVLAASYMVKGILGVALAAGNAAALANYGLPAVAWACALSAVVTLIACLAAGGLMARQPG